MGAGGPGLKINKTIGTGNRISTKTGNIGFNPLTPRARLDIIAVRKEQPRLRYDANIVT